MRKSQFATLRVFAQGAVFGSVFFFGPAWAADSTAASSDLVASVIVLAAGALAVACCFWALSERARACAFRRSARAQRANAHAAVGLRDAVIAAGGQAILMWGPACTSPLSFGGAASLFEACLAGSDADALSAAQEALIADGVPFSIALRTSDQRTMSLRGLPIAAHAAVFLEEVVPDVQGSVQDDDGHLDYRAVLDALPVPVWIRAKDMTLGWVNLAFLDITGVPTREEAIKTGIVFDRSERDLAIAARDTGEPITAKRYAMVGNSRRVFSFSLCSLSGGGVAGMALDLNTVADATLKQQMDAYAATLNGLSKAVAIFGPDRRLSFYNRAYAQLWGLPRSWLDNSPTLGNILDRLREARRLPEQADFASWKSSQLSAFGQPDLCSDELWHLPGGRSLRVMSRPHPHGGLSVLMQDVSEPLRLERLSSVQRNVQKTILEMFPEGAAIFGSDGRLKSSNAAFARLWRLAESDLGGEPHMSRVAEASSFRIGCEPIWEIVSKAISSAAHEQQSEPTEIERADRHIISVSLARLPDSSTFVSFTDMTDQRRLEQVLRETAMAAA